MRRSLAVALRAAALPRAQASSVRTAATLQRCAATPALSSSSLSFSLPSQARCFSSSAATESAPLPAPATNLLPDEYTHPRELDPTWRSPTQRVMDVLATGPKTRWQVYYALNRGPAAPPTEEQLALAAEARARAVRSRKGKPLSPEEEAALVESYPTGILRNPTHLARILRSLAQGKRVWTRPYASVEARMGEAEQKAIQDIIEGHPAPGAAKLARPGRNWYYVSADWSDPGFRAKREQKQTQFAAKVARREARLAARIAEAEANHVTFAYERPPGVTKAQRLRAEKERKEAAEKAAVKKAVRQYHEELGLRKPREQAGEEGAK